MSQPADVMPVTKAAVRRFNFEDDSTDFPFYNGIPTALTTGQWLVAWGSLLFSFCVLSFVYVANNEWGLITQTLFTLIPLATLMGLVGKHWKALFRKVRLRDVGLMLLYMLYARAVCAIATLLTKQFIPTQDNPITRDILQSKSSVWDTIWLYVGSAIQLMGEELWATIPLLALIAILTMKFKVSRKKAIIIAWVVSSLWFGALHAFGTYTVLQALIVITVTRLPMTLAYLRTKNLWVSYGSHVMFDGWSFLLITLNLGISL